MSPLPLSSSRKVTGTEGRVSEPLERGHDWMLWETVAGIKNQGSLRAWDSFRRSLKGCRSKSSPTRPSVSWSIGEQFFRKYAPLLPDGGRSMKRLHRPNHFRVWLHEFQGETESQGPYET